HTYTLLGHGTGKFGPASPWPLGAASGADPWAVTSCDLNGHRHPDLIVADHAFNALAVLLGYGNGTFAPAYRIDTGSQPVSVVCADFSGDGKPDLVSGTLAGGLLLYLGKGDGTVVPPVGPFFAGGSISVAAGDFAPPGGDGKLDLAVVLGDAVYTLAGNGNGTFQSSVKRQPQPGSDVSGVAIGDFDGDGRNDLAVALPSSTTVYVYFASGGGFGQPVSQPLSAQRPGAAT